MIANIWYKDEVNQSNEEDSRVTATTQLLQFKALFKRQNNFDRKKIFFLGKEDKNVRSEGGTVPRQMKQSHLS